MKTMTSTIPGGNVVAKTPMAATAPQPPTLDEIADTTAKAYGPDLFAPRTRGELDQEADGMYRAGLLKKYLPRDANGWTPQQRYAFCTARAKEAILAGADLGVLPRPAVRGIYFVEDQPCPSARLLVAAIRMRIKICEYWTVEEASDQRCTIVTKRRGAPKEARLTVTVDQFKSLRDEKNYKGDGPKRPTWTLYPSRMLLARCSSWLANQEYADITMGLHAAEDMALGAFERKVGSREDDSGENQLVEDIMGMVDDGSVEAPMVTPPPSPSSEASASAAQEELDEIAWIDSCQDRAQLARRADEYGVAGAKGLEARARARLSQMEVKA